MHVDMVTTVNIGEVRSYISGKEKFLLLEENFFSPGAIHLAGRKLSYFRTIEKSRARVGIY